MASARPYPPSAQRLAEARAAGQLPTAMLASPGALLLGLSLSALVLGPRIGQSCLALLRGPLEQLALGQPAQAHADLFTGVRALSHSLALALSLTLGVLVLVRVLTQGLSFAGLGSAQKRSFTPAAPSRTASALWALGLTLVSALALADSAALGVTGELLPLLSSWAGFLCALTLACLTIDIAFARARFFASLWLGRRDYLDEQRAAFGAPEIRSARERARQRERAER